MRPRAKKCTNPDGGYNVSSVFGYCAVASPDVLIMSLVVRAATVQITNKTKLQFRSRTFTFMSLGHPCESRSSPIIKKISQLKLSRSTSLGLGFVFQLGYSASPAHCS